LLGRNQNILLKDFLNRLFEIFLFLKCFSQHVLTISVPWNIKKGSLFSLAYQYFVISVYCTNHRIFLRKTLFYVGLWFNVINVSNWWNLWYLLTLISEQIFVKRINFANIYIFIKYEFKVKCLNISENFPRFYFIRQFRRNIWVGSMKNLWMRWNILNSTQMRRFIQNWRIVL